MATKSVIDIDINDAKFKEFTRMFEKYQKSLGKMPGEWGKINKSVDGVAGSFDKIQHALDTIAVSLDKNYKTLKNSEQHSSKMATNFAKVATHAKNMSLFVAESTFNILKWGVKGVGLGLLGVGGGLFGLSSLASSASNTRTQSQGLGVTAGELKSAKVNFGRYGDAEGLLQGIAGAQNDLSKQWAFQAAGLNPNQDASRLLPQTLKRAGEVYNAGPAATAGQRLDVSGLSQLGVSVTQARQYASLKKEEIATAEKHYNQDVRALDVNDSLLRKWQDLDTQLDRAGSTISNSFINGLQGLAKPVEALSVAFSDAVNELLKSPKIGKWVQSLGNGIKSFADYLSGPKIEKDIDSFLGAIESVAKALVGVSDFINRWFNGDNSHATTGTVFEKSGQKSFTNNFLHPQLGDIPNDGIPMPKKMALVPFSEVPAYNPNAPHQEMTLSMQRKFAAELNASKSNVANGAVGKSANNGPSPWNPTSISLNVKTTKVPGMDTDVNMLNAGGYYTGIRNK
jgi:hypothetical protein